MTAHIVRLLALLLLSLLVGTMFGIWLGFNPSGLSAASYVEQQQNTIRALNTTLPVLGAVCIALTTALALLTKNDPRQRNWLSAAALCLVGAGLVTRLGNQPINALVMGWSAQAPPANWSELRDAWWHWHIVRTAAGIGALVFSLMAVVGRRPQEPGPR